jgi:hypothetical protein
MLPKQSAAYCPEELSLFGQVLDAAFESLPLALRTASNRTAIAKHILSLAATGVRDELELRQAATMGLTITVAASSPAEPLPSNQRRSHTRSMTAARLPPFRQTRTASWIGD